MQTKISLDEANRQYVIHTSEGYSVLSYQSCYDNAIALAEAMRRTQGGNPLRLDFIPAINSIGTMECYQAFQKLIAVFSEHPARLKPWYMPGTPAGVINAIAKYRNSGDLLRVFLGDRLTGRDSCEENASVGRIGLQGGLLKRPVLVELGAGFGDCILTERVVRLMDVATNREVYRHPQYRIPELSVEEDGDAQQRLAWCVVRESICIAAFESREHAQRHADFLTGKVAATPRQLNAEQLYKEAA